MAHSPIKILCIVGARPNFMKIAPIMRAFNRDDSGIQARLLHTGQHYDEEMKKSFFGDPRPADRRDHAALRA